MNYFNAQELLAQSQLNSLPAYLPQAHECELFRLAYAEKLPLLIKGPTGCGKTRFVAHMAAQLQRPLITIACHDDLSAADLTGRYLLRGQQTEWQDGPLTQAVRQGAICYLDEVVEARKDTTVILHPLSDDRRVLPLERTAELLTAHENFMLVMSYNPGYQHITKNLKPSTRQRFIAIQLDYPAAELEQAILMQETAIDQANARQLVLLAKQIRQLSQYDLEEAASTRLLVYAAKLISAGCAPAQACHAALSLALSDDAQTVQALSDLIALHF